MMKRQQTQIVRLLKNRWIMGIGLLAFLLVNAVSARAQEENKDNKVGEQHALIGVAHSDAATDASQRPYMQWYREAGLGMFVHWGISSVEGKHELSWAMLANISWNPKPILPEDYFKFADRFNPQSYDPDKWFQAAKDAGFGYAVLTTRHHDGYALWPSEYGDFSTRTHLGGRDLVRPFVEACRKAGLKVGFYYSPPDWYFNRRYMSFGDNTKGTPESPHLNLRHEPIQLPKKPAGFDDQYVDYINGQITELMTQYGKIDVLWFDGGAGPKVLSQEKIRAMQPGIIINDRQHGTGDMNTQSEGDFPKTRPQGDWENCFCMGHAWGYIDSEMCQPAADLLVRLVKCRAWGGNVLVNFAPRPTGEMTDSYYQCMADLQAWMAKHRDSVVSVLPGPGPERCNVPVTIRDKTWYFHILPEKIAGDAKVSVSGVEKPRKVTLHGTDHVLDSHMEGDTLTITMPKDLRTNSVDVIAVEW